MLAKPTFGVRVLSISLGALGGSIPVALLFLDEVQYDLYTFVIYCLLLGLPGFFIPYALTRMVAWFLRQLSH